MTPNSSETNVVAERDPTVWGKIEKAATQVRLLWQYNYLRVKIIKFRIATKRGLLQGGGARYTVNFLAWTSWSVIRVDRWRTLVAYLWHFESVTVWSLTIFSQGSTYFRLRCYCVLAACLSSVLSVEKKWNVLEDGAPSISRFMTVQKNGVY